MERWVSELESSAGLASWRSESPCTYVLRSIRHEVQAPHRSLIRHPVRVATVAPPAAAPHDPGAPSPGLVRVRRSLGTARNPRQPDRWLQVHPPRRTPASSPARNAFASCPRPFRAAGLVLCRCVLPDDSNHGLHACKTQFTLRKPVTANRPSPALGQRVDGSDPWVDASRHDVLDSALTEVTLARAVPAGTRPPATQPHRRDSI